MTIRERELRAALLLVPLLLPAAAQGAPRGGAEAPRGVAKGPRSTALDVRDFGAVGDGKADDTPAIQKAIDAATHRGANGKRQAGGTVYLPPGKYRTTAPLRLHTYVVLTGDEGQCRGEPRGAWIESEADAGLVCWEGPWPDGQKIETTSRVPDRACIGVVVKNLAVKARKFAFHTMGCAANYLRVENCRFEGGVAAFVSTGYLMFSRIDNCAFDRGMWFLADDGTSRFNTSEVSNVLIGLHGVRNNDWAVRIEGCVQCVSFRNITLEVQSKGVLVDARYAGVSIALDGIWSYDVGQPAEVVRIKAGESIRVSNVMATDQPADLHVEGGSRVFLQGVLAHTIHLHGNTSVTALGCTPVAGAGAGCVIEGEKVR